MSKSLSLIFLLMPCFLMAQEICNNGIDDDGDLLIDLIDDECYCGNAYSLIPNFSFEDTSCCPFSVSLMGCVDSWLQASIATSDYLNFCDFLIHEEFPLFPNPIPDGNGFVGFYDAISFDEIYKEYIGVCLPLPMEKDSCYVLDLFVGFGEKTNTSAYSLSPFELSVYGNTDCASMPFEGQSCPLQSNTPGWNLLHSEIVEGSNEWVRVTFEIIPDENVEALVFGPNCTPATFSSDRNYYYLDAVALYEKNSAPIIYVASGLPCLENVILAVPVFPEVSYQWYFNGIAISESTENTFHIPEGEETEGIYQVMIYSSESCFISPPYTYEINGFPVADLESEAVICQDEILLLGEKNIGISYIWNTGDTTQTIAISEPGIYSVTVSNACGSSVAESIIYDDGAISSCTFVVPNAFSPDGDGHNDVFRALTECCLTKYSLQVFSRWGNLVFQSDDFSKGWNGTYKGAPLPTDVYIWKASWSVTLDGREKTFSKAGDVLLIR